MTLILMNMQSILINITSYTLLVLNRAPYINYIALATVPSWGDDVFKTTRPRMFNVVGGSVPMLALLILAQAVPVFSAGGHGHGAEAS